MQETKNKSKNSAMKDDMDIACPKVYEVGYLLVPTISEEEVPARYGDLKELINSFGGQIISDEMPAMITLAYKMLKVVSNVRSKFDTAYFGWTKFVMDPEKVVLLKKKMDTDPNIIRFLIIKTVKENTVAAKRFTQKDITRRKVTIEPKKVEGEEVAPINKEEIDKEIDAMIAE